MAVGGEGEDDFLKLHLHILQPKNVTSMRIQLHHWKERHADEVTTSLLELLIIF